MRSKDPVRGSLTALEFNRLPFEVRRIYWVHLVKGVSRGHHAHLRLFQAILCISGEVVMHLTDIEGTRQITLVPDSEPLLLVRPTWREFYSLSSDSVLLVLASEDYDSTDYVTVFKDFLGWLR